MRKKLHHDARHNCFAWLIEDGTMRYSDDGEPQGTAGLPILDVIKKTGLENVLVVVTRYFGGILLGAGGLGRAYTQSAAEAIESAAKVKMITRSVFRCDFDFAAFSRIQAPLTAAGCTFEDISYSSTVSAQISVNQGDEAAFLQQVTNLTSGKTVPFPEGQKRVAMDI